MSSTKRRASRNLADLLAAEQRLEVVPRVSAGHLGRLSEALEYTGRGAAHLSEEKVGLKREITFK